jgi:hypothetical protein
MNNEKMLQVLVLNSFNLVQSSPRGPPYNYSVQFLPLKLEPNSDIFPPPGSQILPGFLPDSNYNENMNHYPERISDPNDADKNFSSSKDIQKKSQKEIKQERNRVCARECRKRKKQYMNRLEDEVRLLKQELLTCKKELEILKSKQRLGLFGEYGFLKQNQNMKDKILEDAKIAIESNGYEKQKNVLESIKVIPYLSRDL